MSVHLVVHGHREARKLLSSLSGRELENRTRRGTRAGAAIFRAKVRAAAKSRSDIPDSFARTKTRGHRSPVGTSTGPTSPLLNIFEPGAGRHTIAPGWRGTGMAPQGPGRPVPREGYSTGKLLLSGKGGDRWRSRDFVASGPVSHPGMAARPLIAPVFEANKDEATEAAFEKMLEGLR